MDIPLTLSEESLNVIHGVMLKSAQEAFSEVVRRQKYPRYMTIKDASSYAGVAVNTFRKDFINKGLKVIDPDGLKRIDKNDIDEFMENMKF
jgi:hypothetical protein